MERIKLVDHYRFAQHKDRKEFCQDMKRIYTALTEKAGLEALERLASKWQAKYAYAVKSWYDNWEALSRIYRYTPEIRSLILYHTSN